MGYCVRGMRHLVFVADRNFNHQFEAEFIDSSAVCILCDVNPCPKMVFLSKLSCKF